MTLVQDAVIINIPLKTNQRDRIERKLVLTGRYMQPLSVPRKLRSHHDRFVMAAQVARLTPGLAHGVTVFAYPEK